MDNSGLDSSNSYPYLAVYGQCKSTTGIFKITNFTTVKSCDKLDSALMNQPISVALDATNMYNYDSGIFSACSTAGGRVR